MQRGNLQVLGPIRQPNGSYGLVVSMPIWIEDVDANATFGLTGPVFTGCGAPCDYNETTRTKPWGLVRRGEVWGARPTPVRGVSSRGLWIGLMNVGAKPNRLCPLTNLSRTGTSHRGPAGVCRMSLAGRGHRQGLTWPCAIIPDLPERDWCRGILAQQFGRRLVQQVALGCTATGRQGSWVDWQLTVGSALQRPRTHAPAQRSPLLACCDAQQCAGCSPSAMPWRRPSCRPSATGMRWRRCRPRQHRRRAPAVSRRRWWCAGVRPGRAALRSGLGASIATMPGYPDTRLPTAVRYLRVCRGTPHSPRVPPHGPPRPRPSIQPSPPPLLPFLNYATSASPPLPAPRCPRTPWRPSLTCPTPRWDGVGWGWGGHKAAAQPL